MSTIPQQEILLIALVIAKVLGFTRVVLIAYLTIVLISGLKAINWIRK